MIITALLIASLLANVYSEAVPKHLREKLRNAASFLEFAENVEIIYHPVYTNQHAQKTYATPGPRQPMRISAANFLKSSSRLRNLAVDELTTTENSMDVDTAEHLSLFSSIRQGNDTCQLQSVCVPIPLDNGDPQIVIYPKCYEVMQCVGSCCDSDEHCHPHSIRKLERPVIEMLYVGNGRFMLNQTLNITMEEHTSCSCFDCGSDVPECDPGFVIGSDCRCQCADKSERNNCEGYREWDEETCRCVCEPISCPSGQMFDENRCDCVHRRREGKGRLAEVIDTSTPVDLSSLPRLKAKVVRHDPGIFN